MKSQTLRLGNRPSGPLAPALLALGFLATLLLAQADDVPAKTEAEIDALVARLSAGSAAERESAERALIAMGERIIPRLERRMAKTEDEEIRSRLQRVLALLPFADEAKSAGVDAGTFVWCKSRIDALTTPAAREAVAALLERSKDCFPVLIARLDDLRPMGVDGISFAARANAHEAVLHYGPRKVVDCLTIVLCMSSDQSFGFLHNGGTDGERREVVRRWRDWYRKARPFLVWDPEKRRHVVDDAAWWTGIPVDRYRRLPRRQRTEELDRAFRRRDRAFERLAGIAPRPAEGELELLIAALAEDPYRPPTFDSPPAVSATMRKLAARGEDILPAIAHAYHRALDRSFCVSLVATVGELRGARARKVLEAWKDLEHRQRLRRALARALRRSR